MSLTDLRVFCRTVAFALILTFGGMTLLLALGGTVLVLYESKHHAACLADARRIGFSDAICEP